MTRRTLTIAAIVLITAALLSSCVFRPKHQNRYGKGWQDLFNKDYSNSITQEGAWEIHPGGVIEAHHDVLFWTKKQYENFVLDVEFKFDPGANSGILLRTGSIEDWIQTGIEVQIRDSFEQKEFTKYESGAIFDIIEPMKKSVKKAGEWNRFTITCKGSMINVIQNDVEVIHMDLKEWKEAHKNPDGTKNKFRTAYKDMPSTGHIGFQGQHGGAKIWFRHMRIKELK